MRFAEDSFASNTIRAYARGEIIVNEKRITESVIISATDILPWPPGSLEALTPEHLEIILEQQPEVVILGTGDTLTFPAPEIAAVIQTQGIGLEVMATDAACRTFNVLLSEDRHVVAGLILG